MTEYLNQTTNSYGVFPGKERVDAVVLLGKQQPSGYVSEPHRAAGVGAGEHP